MNRIKLPRSIVAQVVLALLLGVACGVFFGEFTADLQMLGDAYVRLLQMTALPYVVAALISGIGRLNPAWAGRIGLQAAGLMAFLWLVSLLTILLIPIAFPKWQAGSYFSAALLEAAEPFDPVAAYLPSNIFESLANMQVPAVVVFCVALGVALIRVGAKEGLLQICDNLIEALGRMASFVVKLAPIGIFAIAASASGTLQVEELGRLQVFFATFLIVSLVLGFWTLPILVAAATPLRYREVVKHAQVAMLTAFATGTVLVVLPLIAESCKQLLEDRELDNEETTSTIDVMVPAAYSLPSAGTILGLSFILFAAWYIGSPLSAAQYGSFSAVAGMASFGGMVVALPYLLDFYRLPADLFQLYLLASVFTVRLATGLAAMHGVVICLLVACAVTGQLNWRRLMQAALFGFAVAAVVLWLSGFVFRVLVPHDSSASQGLLAVKPAQAKTARTLDKTPQPLPESDRQRDRLAVILERGSIRAGVPPDTLPFAFVNRDGELVGFDIELLHDLVRDLNVTLEFVHVGRATRMELLDSGSIDILVGGIAVTPDKVLYGTFSDTYLDQTAAFLVPDHRRREFTDVENIARLQGLKVAVPNKYHLQRLRHALPDVEGVLIDNIERYLQGEPPQADALLYTAEAGSAWTLVFPGYTVVVPAGLDVKIPTAFMIPAGSERYLDFMDTWLELKSKNGEIAEAYDRWILGQGTTKRQPRWSVIRDVLHWVD